MACSGSGTKDQVVANHSDRARRKRQTTGLEELCIAHLNRLFMQVHILQLQTGELTQAQARAIGERDHTVHCCRSQGRCRRIVTAGRLEKFFDFSRGVYIRTYPLSGDFLQKEPIRRRFGDCDARSLESLRHHPCYAQMMEFARRR